MVEAEFLVGVGLFPGVIPGVELVFLVGDGVLVCCILVRALAVRWIRR